MLTKSCHTALRKTRINSFEEISGGAISIASPDPKDHGRGASKMAESDSEGEGSSVRVSRRREWTIAAVILVVGIILFFLVGRYY